MNLLLGSVRLILLNARLRVRSTLTDSFSNRNAVDQYQLENPLALEKLLQGRKRKKAKKEDDFASLYTVDASDLGNVSCPRFLEPEAMLTSSDHSGLGSRTTVVSAAAQSLCVDLHSLPLLLHRPKLERRSEVCRSHSTSIPSFR